MEKFIPKIVYEDNHLIAIDKPSGLLVQGDSTGDLPITELLKNFIKERAQKPGNVFVGLIHRLDRPVSGLVLLAKTSKALERMNKLFQTREVKKEYLALVDSKPPAMEGHL
ncbi:MAG: RNA pseudouridine synthase, partial [Bacteroidetes bacterium]|nr:RNA pseudouridine synthase [Bacteroidota bacterium]